MIFVLNKSASLSLFPVVPVQGYKPAPLYPTAEIGLQRNHYETFWDRLKCVNRYVAYDSDLYDVDIPIRMVNFIPGAPLRGDWFWIY